MADIYTERRPQLPLSYVSFIERSGGWEGDLGDDLGYVVLWERATIQDCYEGHDMTQYLSDRWFPFGSNGGGEMLCFDLASATDQVYWVPFLAMADEEAMLRYETFVEVAAAVSKRAEQGTAADGNA